MHPNRHKNVDHQAQAGARPAPARIARDGASWAVRPQGHRSEAILVPGEHVRLLCVDLPMRQARARVKALPFAIEPLLAEAPEALHTALGPALGEGRFLAAAVSRSLMRKWMAMLEDAGAPAAALIPEPCVLTVPEEDSWAIHREDGRVIVRRPDASGFSTSDTLFAAIHAAAGHPPLAETEPLADIGRSAAPSLDLRQGEFAVRNNLVLPGLRTAAVIALAGAGVHLAIAAADLALLDAMAYEREREAARLLDEAGIPSGTDPAVTIEASLPSGGTARSQLFAMLQRTAGALAGQEGLTVRALRYRDDAQELALDLQAPDLNSLLAAERALAQAGLAASSGPASARDGQAEATIIIQSGGAS